MGGWTFTGANLFVKFDSAFVFFRFVFESLDSYQ